MGEVDERDADRWWDGLPAERKIQLYRWINPPEQTNTPGQLELINIERQSNE